MTRLKVLQLCLSLFLASLMVHTDVLAQPIGKPATPSAVPSPETPPEPPEDEPNSSDDLAGHLEAALREKSPARRAAALKPIVGALRNPRVSLVRNFMSAACEIADGSMVTLQKDVDWSVKNVDLENSLLYRLWAEEALKRPELLLAAEKFANDSVAEVEIEVSKLRQRRRAAALDVLGRTYVAGGKDDAARKVLSEALETDPGAEMAAIALARLEAAAGNRDRALHYVSAAWWDPDTLDSERQELTAVYAKVNGGSLDALEAWLDAQYEKRFPNPLKPTPFVAASNPGKPVLVELFTSASCGPCRAADLAADAIATRYRAHVASVMYHQHIPRPDALTNQSAEHRAGLYAIEGTPTVYVDGKEVPGLGGSTDEAASHSFDKLNKAVEAALAAPPRSSLNGSATQLGDTISVELSIETPDSFPSAARLHVALIERRLSYDGGNGVRFHPSVVRAMMTDDDGGQGRALPAGPRGRSKTFKTTFDVRSISQQTREYLTDYEERYRSEQDPDFSFVGKTRLSSLDASALGVLAFVQDPESGEVLAVLQLTPSVGPMTAGK